MAVQTANTALKELGDFQNYLDVLHSEAAELADLLEQLAEQQERRDQNYSTGHQS